MLYCKSPDQAMSDAVEARMELDLRTGAAFLGSRRCCSEQVRRDHERRDQLRALPISMHGLRSGQPKIVNFREENFWKLELSVKGNAQEGQGV